MSTAKEVQEILYDFTQRCFVGEQSVGRFDLSRQDRLFDFLSNGELTAMQVHQMSKDEQKLLRELLTQYVMFLQVNQGLPFPDDFLNDSNKMQLGRSVLGYICHYRWPFPQLLTSKAGMAQ